MQDLHSSAGAGYARRGGLIQGVALVLVAILVALLGVPAASADETPDLPCEEVVLNSISGTPQTLRGCQAWTNHARSALGTAQDFFLEHHASFGMPASLQDLRLVEIEYGLNSSHVLFQQTHGSIPVYGVYLSVHLDRKNQIEVLHSGYQPHLAMDTTNARITADQALISAQEAIGLVSARGESPVPSLVHVPYDGTRSQLAWQVLIQAADPEGDWEVLVDAVTGDVIKRYNRLVFDQALVFDPNPTQQMGQPDLDLVRWPQMRPVNLQGLDGSGMLRGEYVDVTWPIGYLPASANEPDGNFMYDPGDPRFEEAMVYYHLDTTQRYLQSLGYSNQNDPPNGIRDRVTYASAHWFEEDQSFYSVADDALHFGDGGINDAEDADIIIHEYAHALQHDQLACWGGGEMGALGEGFGDYLAASRFADVGSDSACIGEWDSTSYAEGPPYCLRRVDRDRRYPVDTTGDPHVDGEMWSRVLWDLRGEVGARIADTLAIEMHFYLPCAATLADAGQALLDADASVYGGAYSTTVKRILLDRGMWSLPTPTITAPAAGDVLRPGSVVSIGVEPNQDLNTAYVVEYSLDGNLTAEVQEAFDTTNLPGGYETYGNVGWQVVDGAIRSGAIDHNQRSVLSTSTDLAQPGEFSFMYRVSTEQGWDFLEVFVDDHLVLSMSGELGWATYQTTLDAGPHRVVWRYRKDSTSHGGEDQVWIDNVTFDGRDAAAWRPAEVDEGQVNEGVIRWHVPETESSAAKVRIRSALDGKVSPWQASGRFMIGEPTVIRLSDFGASGTALSPQIAWGSVLGARPILLYMLGLGVCAVYWFRRSHRT